MALIQLLVELNQSVIITSHTHSAVDNVCLRLMKYGVENILRLGDSSKVHKSLIGKSEREVTKNCKTPEELEKCYNDAVSRNKMGYALRQMKLFVSLFLCSKFDGTHLETVIIMKSVGFWKIFEHKVSNHSNS